MSFAFSDQVLRRLIAAEPVGSDSPYSGGDEQEIEAHLRALVGEIASDGTVSCHAEWNHFGSGYASFVHVLCFDARDGDHEGKPRLGETSGIWLSLSRLAPVAALAEGWYVRGEGAASSWNLPGAEEICDSFPAALEGIHRRIRNVLAHHSISILSAADAARPLPFEADISTNLGEPPFRIFDAIFYWYD